MERVFQTSLVQISLSLLIATSVFAVEPRFYRGVNLGGQALIVNGSQWDGDDAANLICKDRKLVLKKRLVLKPQTDKIQEDMLHTFRWNNNTHLQFTNIPNGLYSIWLYILEDNNSEVFDIFAEKILAVRQYKSGSQGTWRKVGPIVVEVVDHTIDLATRGGAANICGVEIWKGASENIEPLRAPQPPLSPFVGKFAGQKPRVVVMTDIGGDPDDRQSLVRYLLYTCDLETEGFCTGFGWGHDKKTRPDLIHKAIQAYEEVLPSLCKHRHDYPSAFALHSLVKDGHNGDPHTVGPGMDSDASDWIIKVLQKDDPRPVWFTIWGGPRELAQAIWKMEHSLSPQELKQLKAKIRVHSIADQDRSALWIKKNHPDVFYLFSKKLYRGIWSQGDQAIVSAEWLNQNVLQNHGALGSPDIYPANAAGKKGVKEGDTPSYLYLLRNGLSDPESPEWGGWGGRFQYSGYGNEFLPAQDMLKGRPDMLYTIWRWRTAFQSEFASRMDWCVKPYNKANHDPVAVCNGVKGVGTLFLKTKPGALIKLSAVGSSDPDGNHLNYRWWNYRESGSYDGNIDIVGNRAIDASLAVPTDASGKTIHVILEILDDGNPQLTAYRRIVISVE